jgi:aldehyde dehydrogenase (NAD+)
MIAIEEARRVFALQQAHRWTVANSTAEERSAKLARLKAAILAHRSAAHDAMWADFHKSSAEVEITEIAPALIDLDHARTHVEKWMQPAPAGRHWLLAGTRSEVRYGARGVVLVMAPWNYPFGLVITPLVAAVAAGNCAVLRPSEKVPRTAEVLARIVRQAFEEREVACITEPGIELAGALLTLPFDHVFFTGSTRTGRQVMAAAAEHLASVTLELGGKSPLIVDDTADAEAAGTRAAWGKFVNAGQTCIAPDYALVHQRVAPTFVESAKRTIARFYGASEEARQTSPDLPRLIDEAAFRRVVGLLEDAVASGARVEIGGRTSPADRYIAPTILTNVDWESPMMKEEIFGPVLPVLTFQSIGEAINRINGGPTPLALYLFSRSNDHIERVLCGTASGGVAVNDVLLHYGNPHLPFGGLKESGHGSYHGWYGFRTFSHERSVLRQGRLALARFLYPPYGRRTRSLLRIIGRFTS